MDDVGIVITPEDIDARQAESKDLLMSSRYPLMMLDPTNTVSFQNINVTFVNNPPNPDGTTSYYQDTTIDTLTHGYDYKPATWIMFTNPSNETFKYGNNYGVFDAPNAYAQAILYHEVDDTKVYIKVRKFYDALIGAPTSDISSQTLKIRLYVFAQDLDDSN